MSDRRVLSIQSHVVSGYVGNRSAVFPLQLLGFEVDFINSVQFSNHTWYKVFKGQVLNDKDISELYEGLKENNIHHYSHVLTGYIGSDTFLNKVCEIVKELKQVNPGLVYVCDPVMGDDGVMYVPESLIPIYQNQVLSIADVILPNQMEAEKLTNCKINSEADVLKTFDVLHSKGPSTVVLTSTSLGDETVLIGYASKLKDGKTERVKLEVTKLSAMFIGTGDLFAALFLAWSVEHPDDLQLVCSKVQSTMNHVLKRTLKCALEQAGDGNKPNWAQLELKLIQSKRDIETPQICVKVAPL